MGGKDGVTIWRFLRVDEGGLGSGWVRYAVSILTIKGGGDATQ